MDMGQVVNKRNIGMVRLNKDQLNKKLNFIDNYIAANNAADGSMLDPNSNVATKNIATMSAEINKDINIQVKRQLVYTKLVELFGKDQADKYINQLEEHEIYAHDESGLMPYCAAISMYPFLQNGLQDFGGESKAPKHLSSFNGGFINLMFALSSQFCGAVATVEYLMCFDYFARKDYGDNYLENNSKDIVKQELQQVVYALNQPASARGFQCVREDTTQLSTPNGFKYLNELKEGDECYVRKEDGTIGIDTIDKLNIYDYKGELVQFNGRNYQQTVTPNHRVVYKVPNTNKYDIKEAHQLEGHSKLSLPIGSKGIDRNDYPVLMNELRLLVAILTDGTIEKDRIRIYKSKNRYGYKELPVYLGSCGIDFTITEAKGNSFGDMVVFTIDSNNSISLLRKLNYTKKVLPKFFYSLSCNQAQLVIDEWSKYDGYNGLDTTQLLQCDNDYIRDGLQQVAIIAGLGSEIYDRTMTRFTSNEKCVVSYLKIFKRTDKRVVSKRVSYEGKIWCPTTKTGVVIFREENGIPYISGNSCFWNISIFDRYYFEALFENFYFPDGSKPKWESLDILQRFFMSWFNNERTKAILTFPVVTVSVLNDGIDISDTEYKNLISTELSEGNSFFVYTSESVDSLSSCCRLRNSIADQINDFSYSLGAGGVMTGSINVITLNMNRFVQNILFDNEYNEDGHLNLITTELRKQIRDIHKYQIAVKTLFKNFEDSGMLPAYTSNFISLDKQYCTIGINGLVEAAEYLGYKADNNTEYKNFISTILKTISDTNKDSGYPDVKFNTELVPGENLGVKFAKWDTIDKYVVTRDCYNSYIYPVENEELSVIDKFVLHGEDTTKYLDGGK